MDLKEFFISNVKENDYHYKFLDFIKKINYTYNLDTGNLEKNEDYKFIICDVKDAIAKFKELCLPDIEFNNENKCWFYLITFYLHSSGYEIKQFPEILSRPPEDPTKFTYSDIRNKLISLGEHKYDGSVPYSSRRIYISNLIFELKSPNIKISDSINEEFIKISTRHASFECMNTDEKLAEIINLIENMLKKNGKYIELDYTKICCGFITNDQIKKYKNAMQCFRHCSDESILERKNYTEEQKDFLIDYGLTIIKAIHTLIAI